MRQQRQPSDPGPLTPISQDVLVIGIGTIGGDVVNLLAERVEDVNGRATPPRLLHLRLPRATGQPEVLTPHELVDSLALSEDNRVPAEHELAQPHWEWLRTLGYQPGEAVRGRQAARVVLFNHLRLGPDLSQLIPKLEHYLSQRPRYIMIVASACEVVGAGLIGDLAALIRCFAPDNYEPLVDALLLTESLDARHDEESAYLAAALYELGRLNTEGRPQMSYTAARNTRLRYPVRSGDDQLLNGLGLILGDNHAGSQQAALILWGALTESQFLNELHTALSDRHLANRFVPAVSLVFAHALVRPLSLLVKLRTHRLVHDLIGRQPVPNVARFTSIPLQPSEIDAVLDASRSSGLLPSVRALYENDSSNGYLRDLVKVLEKQLNSTSHAISEVQRQINWYGTAGRAFAYDVPIVTQEWMSQSYPSGSLEQIRNQLGWVANPTPPPPLYLLAAPTHSTGAPVSVMAVDRAEMTKFVKLAQGFARNMVWTSLSSSETLLSFHQTLEQERYEVMRRRWLDRVSEWRRSVGESIAQIDRAPKQSSLYLNVPESWQTGSHNVVVTGYDPTFALHVQVIQPIPLRDLHWIRDAQSLEGYLNYDVETLVLRILGPDDHHLYAVPVSLQNALPHQEALQHFFEFWYDGQTHRLRRSASGTHIAWDKALWDFISDFEADATLAEKPRQAALFFELLRSGLLGDADPSLGPGMGWRQMAWEFMKHLDDNAQVQTTVAYLREHDEAARLWGDLRRIAQRQILTLTIPAPDGDTEPEEVILADLVAEGLSAFVERYEDDYGFRTAVVQCVTQHQGCWLVFPQGGPFEDYLGRLFRYYSGQLRD